MVKRIGPGSFTVNLRLCDWPLPSLMEAMLREGPNTWTAHLLGSSLIEITAWRKMLKLPPFPRGGSTTQRKEERRRFLERWRPRLKRMYLNGREEEEQAVGSHAKKAIPQHETEFTPGGLLLEIRRWFGRTGFDPQIPQLATALGHPPSVVRDRAEKLVRQGLLEIDGADRLLLCETSAGPVTISHLTPEEVLARYGPIKAVPGWLAKRRAEQADAPVATEEAELAPEPEPEPAAEALTQEEVPDDMGARVNWPPDEECLRIVEEVYADPDSQIERDLTTRFNCSVPALWSHIRAVCAALGRERPRRHNPVQPVKEGVKVMETANVETIRSAEEAKVEIAEVRTEKLTMYLCDTCKDMGFTGGGDSGEFCGCPEGRIRWEKATDSREREVPTVNVNVAVERPGPLLLFECGAEIFAQGLDLKAETPRFMDEYPLLVSVNGKRVAQVWECTAAGFAEGREVRIMRLVRGPIPGQTDPVQGVA